MTEEEDTTAPGNKGIHIFVTIVVTIAIIGFFVGTQSSPYQEPLHSFEDGERPQGEVEPARAYKELMESPYTQNRHFEESLRRLSEQRPGIFDPVERTDEMTAEALASRAENRAYEGAPPTIPHKIREMGAPDCVACHGEGLRIDGKLATPMSHEYMTNCTQCHVVGEASIPAADSRYDEFPLDNSFAGLQRWGSGERAHAGAPPTTPHPTNMREDCASCHGTMARPGIRTTHPWQTECSQCHAPSATLNQQPMNSDLPEFWED